MLISRISKQWVSRTIPNQVTTRKLLNQMGSRKVRNQVLKRNRWTEMVIDVTPSSFYWSWVSLETKIQWDLRIYGHCFVQDGVLFQRPFSLQTDYLVHYLCREIFPPLLECLGGSTVQFLKCTVTCLSHACHMVQIPTYPPRKHRPVSLEKLQIKRWSGIISYLDVMWGSYVCVLYR